MLASLNGMYAKMLCAAGSSSRSGGLKLLCMLCRLDTHMCMLNNAKAVLSKRIEQMPEEGLLLLLEETFPYVSRTSSCFPKLIELTHPVHLAATCLWDVPVQTWHLGMPSVLACF